MNKILQQGRRWRVGALPGAAATVLLVGCAGTHGPLPSPVALSPQRAAMMGDALLHAAQEGHTAVVGRILERDSTLARRCSGGYDAHLALPAAVNGGHEEIVEMLLAAGVSVDAYGRSQRPALEYAVKQSNCRLIERLLAAGASLTPDEDAHDVLVPLAVAHGAGECVGVLLDAGAAIDARSTQWQWNGASAVGIASQIGDTAALSLLIQRGADVMQPDNVGRPPLLLAVGGGQVGSVGMLLDAGVEVDIANDSGWTALHGAAFTADTAMVRVLLERGATVDVRDRQGVTPLLAAVDEHSAAVVRLLCAAGADVDVCGGSDENRCTGLNALQRACRVGAADIAAVLLEFGATLTGGDERGDKLHMAIASGSVPLVELLVAQGMHLDSLCRHTDGLVRTVALQGQVEMLRLLLEHGASVDDIDSLGATSLMYALYEQRIDAAAVLLERGALLDAKVTAGNSAGLTALSLALLNDRPAAVAFLLAKGATITDSFSVTNVTVTSDIAAAVVHENIDAVAEMLRRGASPEAHVENGVPLLCYAAMEGWADVLRMLVAAGARIDARDEHGRTALFYALANENWSVARYLLLQGAAVDALDSRGMTPLHALLKDHSFYDVRTLASAQVLVAFGADPRRVDSVGISPLMRIDAAIGDGPLSEAMTEELLDASRELYEEYGDEAPVYDEEDLLAMGMIDKVEADGRNSTKYRLRALLEAAARSLDEKELSR